MNASTASRPISAAFTEAFTESSPSEALTSFAWIVRRGTGRAPAFSCFERSFASVKLLRPVIVPWSSITPWTTASEISSLSR